MCLNMINTLKIKYPDNARPILYIYIVPYDNYSKLLKIPSTFDKGKGGGKPVRCYDLDEFNSVYGLSQNMLENKLDKDKNISRIENKINELSHIIHSQFFMTNQIICEGCVEALPLFAFWLEENFTKHRESMKKLSEDQILSAQELLNSEENGSFGAEILIPNRPCPFRTSYISSYLLVRGCMEAIISKYIFSKTQAVQYFLKLLSKALAETNELYMTLQMLLVFQKRSY